MATLLPDYSRLIKRRRERLGITHKELADRIGCGESTVYDWEAGRHKPNVHDRLRLFEVMDIYPDVFEEVADG